MTARIASIHTGERLLLGSAMRTVVALVGARSRFSRWRSVRISAAVWYLRLRSFSSALAIISSSLDGIAWLEWLGRAGTPCRIDSKIAPAVAPRNAGDPVAIS